MKKTIKTLLRSGLVCLFCISLLTSSSYAWYTEYVEDNPEKALKSQVLSAELSWKESWTDSWTVVKETGGSEVTSAIFQYEKWEPGYTQVRYVNLENIGNVPLQYCLKVSETETHPVGVDIAQVIDVYFIEDVNHSVTKADLATAKYAGTLAQVILASLDHDGVAHGSLDLSAEKTAAIVLHMQETADNTYNEAYKIFDLMISISEFQTSSTTL